MSQFAHVDLFRQPGPKASLNYLWGRLRARDLSRAEALALLSALHHELGRKEADEPKLYSGYGHFMESLRREMPTVHDYVVAEWTQHRYTRQIARSSHVPSGSDDDPGADGGPGDQTHRGVPNGGPTDRPSGGQTDGSEDGAEPEGAEDADDEDGPGQAQGGKGQSRADDTDTDDLDEDDPGGRGADDPEEYELPDEDGTGVAEDDERNDVEDPESREDDSQEQDEPDAEGDVEAVQADDLDQRDAEEIAAGGSGRKSPVVGQSEGEGHAEWPEVDDADSLEPLEESEEAEDSSPAPD